MSGENPFDDSFRLCDLTWQIYTEQGWVEVTVRDETCGFLRSGFVRPEIPAKIGTVQGTVVRPLWLCAPGSLKGEPL